MTDDGLKALAILPRLENLYLHNVSEIVGETFKYFRSLKKVSFHDCPNINGARIVNLMYCCNELEEISYSFFFSPVEEKCKRLRLHIVIMFLQCARVSLEKRSNGIPLFIRLYNCKICITPIIDVQNDFSPSAKLLFEIDERKYAEMQTFETSFSTTNEEIFLKKVQLCFYD